MFAPDIPATFTRQWWLLAVGDVSSILSDDNDYHDNNEYAVRLVLAGGELGNWEKLGGSTVHNGETWPGMFQQCVSL